jgi:hypothetical protein
VSLIKHTYVNLRSQSFRVQGSSVLNATPFHRFIIHLADGRKVPVKHREFIMEAPNGRTVIVCQPEDTMNIIDLLLVTDLETKIGQNGSGKRRKA